MNTSLRYNALVISVQCSSRNSGVLSEWTLFWRIRQISKSNIENITCIGLMTLVLQVFHHYYAPPLLGGSIMRCFCLTSVWRLSVAYIGPNSRTERPRKTKIGTEVAHVTRD